MIVYNELKDKYEAEGYMPFVCIAKWAPQDEAAAINRYFQIYETPEGQGVKGVHTWNLIGRNSMIVIGWMNSPASLQKFCMSITHGTGISVEVSPAIDHFGLEKALRDLKSQWDKA